MLLVVPTRVRALIKHFFHFLGVETPFVVTDASTSEITACDEVFKLQNLVHLGSSIGNARAELAASALGSQFLVAAWF